MDLYAGAKRVELKRVGVDAEGKAVPQPPAVVFVRKYKPSDRLKIMRAIGMRVGSQADEALLIAMIMRWAIVGAENFTDAETCEPVKFGHENHPAIGKILTETAFDALGPEETLIDILRATAPTPKPELEEIKGN